MRAVPASLSGSPTISPARSALSTWSRPLSKRLAGRAAAAVQTWPKAAGLMATKRRKRWRLSETRWRRLQHDRHGVFHAAHTQRLMSLWRGAIHGRAAGRPGLRSTLHLLDLPDARRGSSDGKHRRL